MKTTSLSYGAVAAGVMGLLVGNANGIILPVAQDAYIEGLAASLDSNFGNDTTVRVGQTGTANGGRKAYFLFDATGLPQIASVDLFQIIRGGGTISRTIYLYAILGPNVDSWSETGITWNNAPGNNVTAPSRDFGAFPGETLMAIGTASTGSDAAAIIGLTFSGLAAADQQTLLDELNTGDRKLTLALRYNSSQDSTVIFRSSEYGDGSSAPALSITLVPEPGSSALLLGGLALLFGWRRAGR